MRLSSLIFFFFLSTAHQQPFSLRKIIITGFAQGTTYHITYYAEDSVVSKSQIDSLFNKLDSSLSIYKPYSLISQFNSADDGIVMDEHLAAVVKKSIDIYKTTNGLFDITVQPLVQAWGFGVKKTTALPGKKEIRGIKKCVASGLLKIEGNKLLKQKPCVSIDVNGIAQGYSVDVLATFLDAYGIADYLVEIGGELKVKGRKQPGNEKMKIGIESPGEEALTVTLQQNIIELDGGAITTSGSYRKYYESEGKKITHLINPKTGYPVQNDLISVTVYAHDAITADAYDNALMVLGWKKGLQFIESRNDIAAYFIYRDKQGTIKDTASRKFYRLLN